MAHLAALHRLTSLNLWNNLRVSGACRAALHCCAALLRCIAALHCCAALLRCAAALRYLCCPHAPRACLPQAAHMQPASSLLDVHFLLPCLPSLPAEDGLAVLRCLPLLEELSLRGCQQLSDACLAHVSGLARLQRLDMRTCERMRGAGWGAGWAALPLLGGGAGEHAACKWLCRTGLATEADCYPPSPLVPPHKQAWAWHTCRAWAGCRSSTSRAATRECLLADAAACCCYYFFVH